MIFQSGAVNNFCLLHQRINVAEGGSQKQNLGRKKASTCSWPEVQTGEEQE
jgi:hypothetical protein